MTIWQRIRRGIAWTVYLASLTAIAALLLWTVMHDYVIAAVFLLAFGLLAMKVFVPGRPVERIPAQGR